MTTENAPCGIEAGLMATEEGRTFLRNYRSRVTHDAVARLQGTLDALRLESGIATGAGGGAGASGESELVVLFRKIIDKINEARSELQSIASMARERETGDINAVEDELAAIISDTERATNEIMDSADAIENFLRGDAGGELPEELRREILRKCADITISCSFQDITGQRVRKIVEVIQHIDQHISLIEHNLGTPVRDPEGSEIDASRRAQAEAGLLKGPGLPGSAVDQSAIDEMFSDPPAESS